MLSAALLSVGAKWLLHGVYQFTSIDWSLAWHYDAGVDWSAAQLFWRGVSPYTPEGLSAVGVTRFGHPPTTAFWFLPLARFDEPTMAHILGLANFAMLLALVATVVRGLRWPLPVPTTLVIFGYLQDSQTTIDHDYIVQLSVAIAFGTVLAWNWLRDGLDGRAGLALGLVSTLKPFPCVILLLLVSRGRWRAALTAAAAFACVAAIMTWRFGRASWGLFLEQQQGIAKYWIESVRNASLHGVLRRIFRARCARRPHIDPHLLELLTLGACALLLGLSAWVALRALRRSPQRSTFDLAYALFCAVATFINPWIWEHYVFILVLPVLIVAHAIYERYVGCVRGWLSGSVSHLRQLGATLLAGVASWALFAIVRWTQVTQDANRLATRYYCEYRGDPGVKAWLLQRAQYLELTSWLPWALVILASALLLLLQARAKSAPESAVTAGVDGRAFGPPAQRGSAAEADEIGCP